MAAVRYALIALLALSTGAHAWHPQYPPWSRPPAGSQCPVAELPAEEGSTQWEGVTHFRDAGTVLAMDNRGAVPTLHVQDTAGRVQLAAVELGGGLLGFHGVERADLNGDGRADYVVTLGSGGVGLAGGNAWRTVVLSQGDRYRALRVPHPRTQCRGLPACTGTQRLRIAATVGDYRQPGCHARPPLAYLLGVSVTALPADACGGGEHGIARLA
ncbi:hypothetical protein A7D17_00710 [Xanthomonas floridensis]|nr:hypothetical protein A7D17_00710 [Xanthomonas floridensis]